jgi:hypothetical protein
MAIPMRMLGLALLALSTSCSPSNENAGLAPSDAPTAPSATPSTSQAVDDAVFFALIQASDGRTVTWDEIERDQQSCDAADSEVLTYQQLFEACYSNEEPTSGRAQLDPSALVVVRPGNDPERAVGADRLPMEISDEAANDVPRQYRAWQIRTSGGRVVSVAQAPGARP